MPSSKKQSLKIGSRQSDLARIQAITVAQYLKQQKPSLDISFFNRPSFGDLNLDMNLKETNSKGVFTQEFKTLLQDKVCDVVVHSWKDLPIEDDPNTEILTLTQREDQRDIFFLKKSSYGLGTLKILTSSPRREFSLQNSLSNLLPFETMHFQIEPIRGNIPTRFSKFLKSEADGFVVAKAAVDRLMLTAGGKAPAAGALDSTKKSSPPERAVRLANERRSLSAGSSESAGRAKPPKERLSELDSIDLNTEFQEIRDQILQVFDQCHYMVLPLSEFPTAAAQGALALEVLKSNPILKDLKKWAHQDNFELVSLERSTHKKYGGGCHQAMGFSALPNEFGTVFFTRGTFEDSVFQTESFKPQKELKTKFQPEDLFSQVQLKSERSKTIYDFEDLNSSLKKRLQFYKGDEFVITRYEAKLEDLKSRDYTVWVSGTKTWAKLAQEGYWINGSLDGLGLEHKPEMSYLKPKGKYWLTNSSSPKEGTEGFKTLATYDLAYVLEDDMLSDLHAKKCFLWMSGHGFETVLKSHPELKNKIHFCGLGRTSETLKKHLKTSQIYHCINEDDFIQQTLK